MCDARHGDDNHSGTKTDALLYCFVHSHEGAPDKVGGKTSERVAKRDASGCDHDERVSIPQSQRRASSAICRAYSAIAVQSA